MIVSLGVNALMMKRILLSLCLAALACVGASADAIPAKIYSHYICCNADGTVSVSPDDLVGTDFLTINNTVSPVDGAISWYFAGDNHNSAGKPFYSPFGLLDYAAIFSGFIYAPTAGTYDFF